MNNVQVTVIGREDCHLCHEAIELITTIAERFQNVFVQEVSLDEHKSWAGRYSEKIPVILIDNREHGYWRIDPEQFWISLVKRGAVTREESRSAE